MDFDEAPIPLDRILNAVRVALDQSNARAFDFNSNFE
jgi:hypothetical protein